MGTPSAANARDPNCAHLTGGGAGHPHPPKATLPIAPRGRRRAADAANGRRCAADAAHGRRRAADAAHARPGAADPSFTLTRRFSSPPDGIPSEALPLSSFRGVSSGTPSGRTHESDSEVPTAQTTFTGTSGGLGTTWGGHNRTKGAVLPVAPTFRVPRTPELAAPRDHVPTTPEGHRGLGEQVMQVMQLMQVMGASPAGASPEPMTMHAAPTTMRAAPTTAPSVAPSAAPSAAPSRRRGFPFGARAFVVFRARARAAASFLGRGRS